MIQFMILGGPRSATTWAANLFTTDTTICLHDPLLEYTAARLEHMTFPGGQRLGISCTASTLWPDWVNSQKCPKVVLVRDVAQINLSLRALGLVELIEKRHHERLAAVKRAMFVPYDDLFEMPKAACIAQHLRVPFDPHRYDVLRQMRIEPMWRSLNIGREAAMTLVRKIQESR
jgi:hypothetical protein